jgi:serine/threonine-protein kinase RsbW
LDPISESDVIRLELPATHKYLSVLEACVSAMLERVESIPERNTLAYNVTLAVHETCTNIVEHAYAGRAGTIKATLSLADEPRRLVIDLYDTGRPFTMPSDIQQPNLEEVQTNGYGLFLIHELMDEVSYRPQSGDNRWRLVKNL